MRNSQLIENFFRFQFIFLFSITTIFFIKKEKKILNMSVELQKIFEKYNHKHK